MSVYEEIAAILHPAPEPDAIPEEVRGDVWADITEARERAAFNLEAAWDAHGEDAEPLLAALAGARRRREEAEAEIRRLVAYGREFTRPRPYKLVDLATASGMSISGVRTAYGHQEVAEVEKSVGRAPREWRAVSPDNPPEEGSAP
ncbi:hypothetical protein [Streptomyces sp. NPDC059003]|uniref:hypothetical protein n=1 Tax=Streptomyces sp. NPDC059003 TaxID=3346691 RepID=UPI0036CC25DF